MTPTGSGRARRWVVGLVAVGLFTSACGGEGRGAESVDTTFETDQTASAGDAGSAGEAAVGDRADAADGADGLDDDDVGSDGLGDPFYPRMGNGGYDVRNYDLRFDVDAVENFLMASATIEAVSLQDLDRFNLDLHGLEVGSISVDGDPASFTRDGDELIVTPASEIPESAMFTTVISYSGTPEPINDPAVPFVAIGWQQVDGTIFTVSEPSGAMSFFPSNNHPTDKATFDITITADEALTSAATGVLVDESTENGRHTTTWRMDDPMATYLAAVYVGRFERVEREGPGGLMIRNYFPTGTTAELSPNFDAVTADAIDFYSELLGAPYPFDVYGSIVLPFSTGFALENQTLSVHGRSATDSTTIAHEILHQWAGNSVTVARWSDIWLIEGLATYLAYLYHEDRGIEVALTPETMFGVLDPLASIGAAEVPIEAMFSPDVYFRGALGLHDLRIDVGDDTFQEILALYYGRHAGGSATTEDFRGIVAELGGEFALEALDPWLFGGLPDAPASPGG